MNGRVDKLSVLKKFEEVAGRAGLGIDEVRLYLLILASSGNAWTDVIAYRTIRDALGEEYSLAMLRRACHLLSKNGLVEVVCFPTEEIAEDSILTYRILSPQGLRGR